MAPKKEKKIFFKAEDGLEVVLQKIEETDVPRVILNFPKGSEAANDVESFHEIKQKAKKLDKEVLVESIDEHILEFASLARIPAVNPVFRSRERAIADIVVRPKTGERVAEKIEETKENDKTKPAAKKKEDAEEKMSGEEKLDKVLATIRDRKEERGPYERYEKQKVRKQQQGKLKRFLGWTGVAAALAGILFVAVYILPEARVTLAMKRSERQFSDTVLVSVKTNAWTVSEDGSIVLPGQLLSATKNAQIEIDAQGTQKVSEKAKGKLTIYNAYSASPQQLVATTRFEAPNGKIFRLDKNVTVPGAKVEGAKITPSSVEAEVTAAEAGEAYNLEPTIGWRIPGFKGTPRYDGFYAENKTKMIGGFEGERPSATEGDLKEGEEKLKNVLENALNAQMSVLLSEQFKLLPGATSFTLKKKELQADESHTEKALLYGEAEMKKIVFIEEMLGSALMEKYKEGIPEQAKVEKLSASYEILSIDFTEGTMKASVSGTVTFVADIDKNQIIEGIRGKNESELKTFVFSLPGAESAKVSLWPFWVKRVPQNIERIDVSIK